MNMANRSVVLNIDLNIGREGLTRPCLNEQKCILSDTGIFKKALIINFLDFA